MRHHMNIPWKLPIQHALVYFSDNAECKVHYRKPQTVGMCFRDFVWSLSNTFVQLRFPWVRYVPNQFLIKLQRYQ